MGTVCDLVSLKNYNRALVKKGIEIIHKRGNKGISKIIDNSKINHSPNVSDLGYIIGPQLNAASRMDDSSLPSKILISEKALDQIENQILNNVIIVKGNNWHLGVLGIVASKIVEKFNKPTIIISCDNNHGIGSARSIVNISFSLLAKVRLKSPNVMEVFFIFCLSKFS